ncbi:hypothetical protein DRO57_07240, partial [Candidatus Bathyarchaeota archaeon]
MEEEEVGEVIGKPAALILIPLTLLTICGVAYTHWSDRVVVRGVVETGEAEVSIKCKLCLGCPRPTCELSQDRQTLYIWWKNIHPCSKLLVALVLKNTGTIPVNLFKPRVEITPSNVSRYFEVHRLLLGPFKTRSEVDTETCKIRDKFEKNLPIGLCCLPRFPMQLDPGQKALLII